MAAQSTRVQALTDFSNLLTLIKEYSINPNLADDLRAEVVSLNKLQEQEQAKHHEALVAIQQKDRVEAEAVALQERMAQQKANHEAHLKQSLDDFTAKVSEERKKMEDERAELDKRKLDLDEYERLLKQRQNQLEEKVAIIKGLSKD